MDVVDEMISHSQISPTNYKARVKSFMQKMNTWRNGRVINLKSFSVDGVKLRMKVYPNGINEDSKGYVSVAIENMNDFKIRLNCGFSFSIGGKKEIVNEIWLFDPNGTWGYSHLYHHSKHHSDRGLFTFQDEDVDCEITFTVRNVSKEVVEEEMDSHSLVKEVKDTVTNLEKRMENLEKSVSALQLSQGGGPPRPQPRYPECPICLENMTHETRIMQCGLGHLLCQKCFDRLDYSSCPSCGKAITGRCHGMETYLKTLFDNNNE